jgi:hypothetical protein
MSVPHLSAGSGPCRPSRASADEYLLLSRLDEQQRRWYVALEANRVGPHGDELLAQITAWTLKRFNVGEKNSSTTWPSVQPTGCDCLVEAAEQRKKRRGARDDAGGIGPARNGGRSQQSSRNGSAVVCAIGAERLEQVGHLVSPPTVARLLRKLGYSLRVNTKKQEGSRAHPERQQQFEYLETQKEAFGTAGLPIRSRDTKKKELIGNAQECRTNMVSTCRRGECA